MLKNIMFLSILTIFASTLLAKAPDGITFPSTVYLEKVPNGTALNFEFCFKVQEDCSLFLVTFKYLDKDGEAIRYRRLVTHHLPDLARFVSVFDAKNQISHCTSTFSKGDFCAITHPYAEQTWPSVKPVFVECTAFIKLKSNNSMQTKSLKVPIKGHEDTPKISLPFKGSWWHLEGHDTFSHHRRIFYKQNTNYFAFDFIKVDEKLSVCKGSGAKNEDYYAFGEPVLAAAEGKIVNVIDGIADNPIGGRAKGFNPTDAKYAGGNTVIIKHGDKLYSYYAHFKKDTICVKKGQLVKTGTKLGICGNSGNSDAPHIHFHLAESPSLSAIGAHGVPPLFTKFQIKAGKVWSTLHKCGLLAGEIVRPTP